MKKTSYFWVGFSDLMTSLFFIMLVLFAIAFVKLKSSANNEDKIQSLKKELAELLEENKELSNENKQLITDKKKFDEIQNVEKALSTLDQNYYTFDPKNKRYRLNIDAKFKSDESDINYIGINERKQLLDAGRELYNKVSALIKKHKEIDYLLVIEGNTQRNLEYKNWITAPDRGYKLSYERALALHNFWKANGIDFEKLGSNCEVILAGSGYFGQSRDENNPDNNRRFTIQVTSKVGKFLQTK
jgi:outer membrane protein OmpA-like peptidoglycan-associated protein